MVTYGRGPPGANVASVLRTHDGREMYCWTEFLKNTLDWNRWMLWEEAKPFA